MISEEYGVEVVETRDLEDEAATQAFATDVYGRVKERFYASGSPSGAFIGLIGNLGAGKTTFTKAFVAAFDVSVEATSPTYTLLNVYRCKPPVYHFDLYRLHHVDDLESVGYWEYVESDGVSCVEWLDRIPEAWPNHDVPKFIVFLEHREEGRRATLFEA